MGEWVGDWEVKQMLKLHVRVTTVVTERRKERVPFQSVRATTTEYHRAGGL